MIGRKKMVVPCVFAFPECEVPGPSRAGYPLMHFVDKVAIVTGGGSGIGRATCKKIASEGAAVLVVDISADKAEDTVSQIVHDGGQAASIRVDVSNSREVQAAVSLAVKRWKKVDVLVINAAIMTFNPVVDLNEDDWDRVLAVNLKSAFLFSKYAIPHMPPFSNIVNVSSVHAHASEAGVSSYAASKGGMEAFARVLALECESRKIRVNCVAPGAVDTPMLWANPNVKSGREKVAGAIGKPDDIADAICFITSRRARFINGTTLVVDGARLDILD